MNPYDLYVCPLQDDKCPRDCPHCRRHQNVTDCHKPARCVLKGQVVACFPAEDEEIIEDK